MTEGLNKAILIGNLGMAPELRHTDGGNAILRMRLATTESYKDKRGDRQERTEWHTVTVWGKRAEALAKILEKGRSVCVEGRIQSRQWEDREGNKRTSTEIHASEIVLLGGKRADRRGRGTSEDGDAYGGPQIDGDDLPF